MSTTYYMDQCKRCRSAQQFLRPKTSHVLHLLLSLVTFGVWVIIWLLVAASHSSQAQCTGCGTSASGLRWGHVLVIVLVGFGLVISLIGSATKPVAPVATATATGAHPVAVAAAKPTPAFDKSEKAQADRVKLMNEAVRIGIIQKITISGGTVPYVWTMPAFYGLTYDQKESFARAMYAYFFNGTGATDFVRLVDAHTGKDVGMYSMTLGLEWYL